MVPRPTRHQFRVVMKQPAQGVGAQPEEVAVVAVDSPSLVLGADGAQYERLPPLPFWTSISTVIHGCLQFTGRSRRSEFWWWILLVSIVLTVANHLIGWQRPVGREIVSFLFLAIVLLSVAAAVRRLHDTGRHGGFVLLGLIPLIGQVALALMLAQDSLLPSKYRPAKYGQPAAYRAL